MKTINPFDRQKKRDFVPLSLFPASKVVRTSTKIGVATPVYCNEMVQGNKIKLTLSEFTRFASLSKPVMNNFRVEFGAYFVPFHSLDVFSRNARPYQSGNPRPRLDARKFFNPSTPDEQRVKFGTISANTVLNPNGDINSGLFAHLGYPTNFQIFDINKVEFNGVTNVPEDEMRNLGYFGCLYGGLEIDFFYMRYDSDEDRIEFDKLDYSGEPQLAIPTFTEYIYTYHPRIINSIHVDSSVYTTAEAFSRLVYFARFYLPAWAKGNLDFGVRERFGMTFDEAMAGYIKYCHNLLCLLENNIKVPLTRWLAYNRIYGDWFLNELYTNHDDFFDAIGNVYNDLCYPDPDVSFGPRNFNTIALDPILKTWHTYIRNNRCYPVLWSKDRFTAAQVEETMSSTPIGSTITENFFNRMYARFKDLIARMGSDYKTNTSALYGHTISDDTLQRSQLVGYRHFDVSIGDIAQTSSSDENGRLGQFAGFAVSAKDKSNFGDFEWTADENGLFMVLMWVRPMYTSIVGAVDRQIFHNDYFDYLLPQFGGVGYQDISNAELGINIKNHNNKFLIQERYSEYMSCLNECSADMSTVLSDYHSDRYLPEDMAAPVKNGNVDFLYMTDKDNLSRIFAGGDTVDPVFCTLNFEGSITRQLPATIQTEF